MKTYDLCNMHEGHVVSDVVLSIEKNLGKYTITYTT